MTKTIIFGTSKLAELSSFYFRNDSNFDVVAFAVDGEYMKETKFEGLPVIAFEEVEEEFSPQEYKMFIAIGYKKLNKLRESKYFSAKLKGYDLVSYISSKTIQWGDIQVGDNCLILENQVIQPTVKIGNNVIIWSGNHFGHNVVVGDHSWLSSHIVLSGGVQVGSNCFLGVNSAIRDNVRIGEESIIGAGALILNDVEPKSVFVSKQTDLYPLNSDQFERMMDISK